MRSTSARGWVLTLGLLAGLPARADTFRFREDGRPPLTGKVVAEFPDTLYVEVDGAGGLFISRVELAQVEDATGLVHENPAPGALVRLLPTTPAAAVSASAGEVRAGQPATPVGQLPAFLLPGARVVTGEFGQARLVLLSGAGAALAPGTSVQVLSGAGGRERLLLDQGELSLEVRLRPVELELEGGGVLALQPGALLQAARQAGSTHLVPMRGQCEVRWPDARLPVPPGSGVELRWEAPGGWQVVADAVNPAALELQLSDELRRVEPGQATAFGSARLPEGAIWRLLAARDEVWLRRAGQESEVLLPPGKVGSLALGDGDELRSAGEARLGRADGALLTLEAGSAVRLGAPLELLRGAAGLECGDGLVDVASPAGVSHLRQTVVRLIQLSREVQRAEVTAGPAALGLGVGSVALLERGAAARLSAEEEGAFVLLERGSGQLRSQETEEADPRFRVQLVAGESVGVRREAARGAPQLLLPGRRELTCQDAALDVEVVLDPAPELRFAMGSRVRLAEGLRLGLGRAGERPELRFVSGPRLRLQDPFSLLVHNPTAVLDGVGGGPPTTFELRGDVAVRLSAGGRFSPAALAAREADRLELLPGDAGASASEGPGGQLRYALGDGRQVWIEPGAPDVQARLGDAQGTLYLSIPGAAAVQVAPARRVILLVTARGEVLVISGEEASLGGERQPVSGAGLLLDPLLVDRARTLLNVPRVDSPSGP